MARERDVRGLPEEIEELFADLWQVPRFGGLRRGFRPNVDCVRIDDPPALRFTFELAGIAAGDIHVDATSTTLSVRGRAAAARRHRAACSSSRSRSAPSNGSCDSPSRSTPSRRRRTSSTAC